MKLPLIHYTLVIFIAIGLIVVSTAALSFYSYRYTVGRESLAATSLVQSNIRLALNYIDRIERDIIANDLALLKMVDIDNPDSWPETDEQIRGGNFSVDQVYMLKPDSNYPIYPPYSFGIRDRWGDFRTSFDVNEINLDNLVPGQPYHLHKERSKKYFFATYMIRDASDGSRILVCYQMNFDRVIALLDRHLRDLQERFYVSIVDFENNGIYGQPVDRSSQFFFETRFPTTLYKWILQIVPRNYAELEQGIEDQRRTNLFFIILSMSLIFISLAIIYMGWRRDRQLRQLKENFIGSVSHELKTPLSLIRMFSEILVTGRVAREDKKKEYYRIIHHESDRMSRLINNLLDFANLERGIENKNFEKVNLPELIGKALEAYRHEVEKDGFELSLKTDSGVPETYADPNAITMAFLNLLDNSVKYSDGQKKIQVRIEQNNGCMDLSVTDEGIGIPLSEQKKIFDKFYRGSAPTIRRVRGSGIGLAIAKNVAEMHGGEVLVKSEPGKGSTFTLRLPIRSGGDELSG